MTTEKISTAPEKNKVTTHKIARLIFIEGDLCPYPDLSLLTDIIKGFVELVYPNTRYEFVLTPGGIIDFEIPQDIVNFKEENLNEDHIASLIQEYANRIVDDLFKSLKGEPLRLFKETADYLTLGIDGFSPVSKHLIEMVAVCDVKSEQVIRWTGKFYPTESQKNDLIKINDLESHFIELNQQKVVILGCHDLNVFNPRGQANANINGWKRQVADRFKVMCRAFEPDIILQHPHTTDTPRIWSNAWAAVERELPSVKHYASGINYSNRGAPPRADLDDVLFGTAMGDIEEFLLDIM